MSDGFETERRIQATDTSQTSTGITSRGARASGASNMTDPTTFTSSSDSHGRLRGKRPLAFSAAGKGQQTDRDIGGLRRFIQPTGQEDEIEGECGLMGEEGWDENTTEEREVGFGCEVKWQLVGY
ncbi:hypothetical protein AbraIFM66950_008337 [Aspergillus brasiliensis]|nr:hypothetical protein AbraIFM66950_008337 [Aspergillus brasiliensis]